MSWMDNSDIDFGVDFLLFFCDFYQLNLDSRLLFSITDVNHINWLPYQSPEISNKAVVFVRDVKVFASWTDSLADVPSLIT